VRNLLAMLLVLLIRIVQGIQMDVLSVPIQDVLNPQEDAVLFVITMTIVWVTRMVVLNVLEINVLKVVVLPYVIGLQIV
jgi:hypothetical protein